MSENFLSDALNVFLIEDGVGQASVIVFFFLSKHLYEMMNTASVYYDLEFLC